MRIARFTTGEDPRYGVVTGELDEFGQPDPDSAVVALAGACVALGGAGELLQPGNHGSTFGGNPVACAAALAVLRTIQDDDLLTHVTVLGQKLRDGLAATVEWLREQELRRA